MEKYKTYIDKAKGGLVAGDPYTRKGKNVVTKNTIYSGHSKEIRNSF